MSRNKTDSVRVELMKESTLKQKASTEKVKQILDMTRDGKIVILEGGLSSEEQSMLIETTMSAIDQERFKGIEIETHEAQRDSQDTKGFIGRITGKVKRTSDDSDMTIIGPTGLIETLDKNEHKITTMINLD